jgi:hypothetical protein|tara:strand:- start:627 stop:971 length:345 start_codon:yes stop_codon:yes gene_type:complete
MATINKIDILDTDREKIIVHLEGNDELGDIMFWILPNTTDGSDEWAEVTAWLAIDGNNIDDDLKQYHDKLYQGKREIAYPPIEEQLDMQYWDSVNGTTVWKDKIQEIKDTYPKG